MKNVGSRVVAFDMDLLNVKKQKHSNSPLHFFKTFLSRPQHVGSIFPSSKILARAMVADIQLEKGEAVLELGPGTGPITAELAKILPAPESYVAIDREQSFIELLHKKFPNLKFIHGDAQKMHELYPQATDCKLKAVISCLPFAFFPQTLQDEIIKSLDQLAEPGVVFKTFQYAHAYNLPRAKRLRQKVTEKFGKPMRKDFVVGNLPPAYVVTWQKK